MLDSVKIIFPHPKIVLCTLLVLMFHAYGELCFCFEMMSLSFKYY